MVDTLLGERLDHGAHERGCDACPPRLRHDVEIRQPAESRGGVPREREPDRTVVLLRDEREPRLDDLADLRELAPPRRESTCAGGGTSSLECQPLLLEERQIGSGGGRGRARRVMLVRSAPATTVGVPDRATRLYT